MDPQVRNDRFELQQWLHHASAGDHNMFAIPPLRRQSFHQFCEYLQELNPKLRLAHATIPTGRSFKLRVVLLAKPNRIAYPSQMAGATSHEQTASFQERWTSPQATAASSAAPPTPHQPPARPLGQQPSRPTAIIRGPSVLLARQPLIREAPQQIKAEDARTCQELPKQTKSCDQCKIEQERSQYYNRQWKEETGTCKTCLKKNKFKRCVECKVEREKDRFFKKQWRKADRNCKLCLFHINVPDSADCILCKEVLKKGLTAGNPFNILELCRECRSDRLVCLTCEMSFPENKINKYSKKKEIERRGREVCPRSSIGPWSYAYRTECTSCTAKYCVVCSDSSREDVLEEKDLCLSCIEESKQCPECLKAQFNLPFPLLANNSMGTKRSNRCRDCTQVSCAYCREIIRFSDSVDSGFAGNVPYQLCSTCPDMLSALIKQHLCVESFLYEVATSKSLPHAVIAKMIRLWPSLCIFSPELGKKMFPSSTNRLHAIQRLLMTAPEWMSEELSDSIDTINIFSWICDKSAHRAIEECSKSERNVLGLMLCKHGKVSPNVDTSKGRAHQSVLNQITTTSKGIEQKYFSEILKSVPSNRNQERIYKRDFQETAGVSEADGPEQKKRKKVGNTTCSKNEEKLHKVDDHNAFMDRFLAFRQYIELIRETAPRSSKNKWKLTIVRTNLCRDLLDAFASAKRVNLYQPTKITFIDKNGNREDGNDESGLSVELFMSFFREIAEYGELFEKIADGSDGLYLPRTDVPKEDLKAFGRILCRCVIDDLPVSFELGPILLEMLANVQLRRSFSSAERSLNALSRYDPALASMWTKLLNGDIGLDGITSDFFDEDSDGSPVSKDDIRHWIIQGTRVRLEYRRKSSWRAIQEGFSQYLDLSIQLAPFATAELAFMIHGRDDVSVEDLIQGIAWPEESQSEEKTARFKANGCSDVPRHLRSLLEDSNVFDRKRRHDFLEWCTSLSVVPASGIQRKICLRLFLGAGEDALPMTHTCTREVHLPAYTSKEQLRDKLFLALDHRSDGFHTE